MSLVIQKPTGANIKLANGQPVPNDPYLYTNTVLLLHGDGANNSTTIVDSSRVAGGPKTVTAVGDAKISTAQSKFGGSSIAFDGTGDYLTVPANTDFNFGTGDFTWEAWCYVNSLSSINGLLYYGNSNSNRLQILINTSGQLELYNDISGTFANPISGTSSVLANTWTHVAATRQGNSWRVFVDGVLKNTATSSVTAPADQILNLGYSVTSNTNRFLSGYLDDVRITKGIARYTSNFTPPTAAFPDF